jgi:hypothetical protein
MHPELFLYSAIAFALFLFVMRRVVWWYWGIDRMIAAFEDMAVSLRCLPGRQQLDQASQKRPRRVA